MDGKSPRKDTSFRQLFKEYKTRLLDPINVAICTFGSLLFAFIGPYGTSETETLLFRVLFWSLLVWSTSLSALLFAVWANFRFATHPFWFQSTSGSAVFSAIYLFLIWIALRAVYPPSSTPGSIEFYFVTVSITSVIYFSMWTFAFKIETRIIEQLAAKKPQQSQSPSSQIRAKTPCAMQAFLKRLGPNSGTQIIRLAMSDHYIEAHTDTGMHLLYMRFSDAISALKTTNGTQVHRSHWINISQIKNVVKSGQKTSFQMTDNSVVPVSRSRKKQLQDLGVL